MKLLFMRMSVAKKHENDASCVLYLCINSRLYKHANGWPCKGYEYPHAYPDKSLSRHTMNRLSQKSSQPPNISSQQSPSSSLWSGLLKEWSLNCSVALDLTGGHACNNKINILNGIGELLYFFEIMRHVPTVSPWLPRRTCANADNFKLTDRSWCFF